VHKEREGGGEREISLILYIEKLQGKKRKGMKNNN
jgi:hypothetical protein